ATNTRGCRAGAPRDGLGLFFDRGDDPGTTGPRPVEPAVMTNASHRPNAPPASAEELRRLWKRHHRRVLRWIRWASVPRRHVEDVAQDAWMRVFRTLDRYDASRPFVPWLCVLVRRTALDHKKHAPERHEQLRETIEPRSDFHASTPEDRMD